MNPHERRIKMPTLPVYNMNGEQTGEITLADSVFGTKVNQALLHLALVRQMAAERRGTAKAKTRAEVRGGGRKPWRQKGTGRARHGSRRSPIWTGGGVVFPPVPRDYSLKMSKKSTASGLKVRPLRQSAGRRGHCPCGVGVC